MNYQLNSSRLYVDFVTVLLYENLHGLSTEQLQSLDLVRVALWVLRKIEIDSVPVFQYGLMRRIERPDPQPWW